MSIDHALPDGFKSIQKMLELWFQTPLGRSLLANQRSVIDQTIGNLFGFHQAEICVSHRIPVGNASHLGHKFYVLPEWEPDLPDNSLISTHDELSLDHDMVDLVILHHALDFCANPHQALREASRILKPSGHLLIVGFNPLSMWGMRKFLLRSNNAPWNNRFVAASRVEDWLTLLDFKVGTLEYHFYALPLNRQPLIDRFDWLDRFLNARVPLGAYYSILAKKQVGSRIMVAPRWRKKAKVVGLPLVNRIDSKNKT